MERTTKMNWLETEFLCLVYLLSNLSLGICTPRRVTLIADYMAVQDEVFRKVTTVLTYKHISIGS